MNKNISDRRTNEQENMSAEKDVQEIVAKLNSLMGAAVKAEPMAAGIPVRREVSWQRAERQGIRAIRTIKGLFEDAEIKGRDS